MKHFHCETKPEWSIQFPVPAAPEQWDVQGGALASLRVDVTEVYICAIKQSMETQTVLQKGRFSALVSILCWLQGERCWRTQDVFSWETLEKWDLWIYNFKKKIKPSNPYLLQDKEICLPKAPENLGAAQLYTPVWFRLCFWIKKIIYKITTTSILTDGYTVILNCHEIVALVEWSCQGGRDCLQF